jgi:microcystin-dependent protein
MASCVVIPLITTPASSQQPFLGQIKIFAGNFAPLGWMFCNGQLLPISEYEALFNLIGTTYGGDGVTTFALPDLRGRVPVHVGQGQGLSSYVLGQSGGSETVALTVNEMPTHSHTFGVSAGQGNSDSPADRVPAEAEDGIPAYAASPTGAMSPGAMKSSGGSQPHNNVKPYLSVNYIIAVEGIFPTPN